MFFHNINYVTIIVAAIMGMALGFVWYAPWAFGKTWMQTKPHAVPKPMKYSLPAMTVSTLVKAFVISALFSSLIVTSISSMFLVALCVWIGFTVPIKVSDYLFGGEHLSSILISSGYELVSTVILAFIIGIWG